MTTPRVKPEEQNSAYGPACNWLANNGGQLTIFRERMDKTENTPKPYPPGWEQVAEIRVFRATPKEWERLVTWRGDMKKKGWKLLRVTTTRGQLVAVFGRTRPELLARDEAS